MKQIKQVRVPAVNWQFFLSNAVLLIIGYLLATLDISFKLPTWPKSQSQVKPNASCTQLVQPDAIISQEQLTQLLEVPSYSDRAKVQELLKQPYCQLPALTIRAGSLTEREVYPLASNPNTSLVVLFEGNSYVGHGFLNQ
ncbi:MAG: hypothetical protein F6K24_54055 [Okeania sp. SIO2D1]|nr:hypothetical protein [Okeania sp. SIO2D1]